VHTAKRPNGEVRGQLSPAGPGAFSLPIAPKLAVLIDPV
jgi:hypothetical protein